MVAWFTLLTIAAEAQLLQDNFEGNSTIQSWSAGECFVVEPHPNPVASTTNTSAHVLRYHDTGGTFARLYFDVPGNIQWGNSSIFTIKVFVPSSGLTGNQSNQISLKLQNGALDEPWSSQCEIIHPLVLDQWQEVSFDFANDAFLNYNPGSPAPLDRSDFNRVLLQINGENNNDFVLAYLDDFYFEGQTSFGNGDDPVYDHLVWSDEFEGTGAVNSEKWHHQTLLPNGNSWFNGEVQHYTDREANSYVSGGELHIVAKKELFFDQGVAKNYTSARLNSKFAFTYGRVEVRAKLPTGVGTWPAIWMLGKNITEVGTYWDNQGFGTTPWPACGEIDIMEHWGDNQNFVQSAMHTPSSYGATVNHGGQVIPTASTDYHVYTLDWFPDRMVFSVDDVVHYTYQPSVQNSETWPFDEDQFILLNIAIQGHIDPLFAESSMDIDYVRVYQESTVDVTNTPMPSVMRVWPNPATNEVRVSLPIEVIGAELVVFNAHGKRMDQFTVRSEEMVIETGSWAPGIYFIEAISAPSVRTYRLLKL